MENANNDHEWASPAGERHSGPYVESRAEPLRAALDTAEALTLGEAVGLLRRWLAAEQHVVPLAKDTKVFLQRYDAVAWAERELRRP